MTISGVGSSQYVTPIQSYLVDELKNNGLSTDVAEDVVSDIDSLVRSSDQNSPEDVRAALDAQIEEDVANGVLTQEEADLIEETLDEFESQLEASGAPAGGAGGGAPAGGAGGGASSSSEGSSTEVADTETTVSEDGWVTKTVTYTDDSEKTTVTYDPSKDQTRNQEQDQTGAAAALQGLLAGQQANQNTLDYMKNLLSTKRLDIYA